LFHSVGFPSTIVCLFFVPLDHPLFFLLCLSL